MQNSGVFFSLTLLCFLLCCTSSSNTTDPSQPTFPIDVSIRVNGQDSTFYTGTYGNTSDTIQVNPNMVPSGSGNYDVYSASVEHEDDRAFARFYCDPPVGWLKVDLLVDGHLKTWDQTTDPSDTVYVSWQPE